MFNIRLLWKYPTFNHWVAWLKLFSLFSVGRWATVNMEQSAQENKSIIMTITIVRGSLWWKTCWNKIAFESNLQGLSFVMVLEAYISYLMCALVMLISSVFFFYSLVFFYFCLPFLFWLVFFSDSLKIKWWFNALKLWQGHTSIKHSFTHHLIYYSSKIHEKISQFWLVKRNAVFR